MVEDRLPSLDSGVELREIHTFLVLADELHFGHTAERLRLTPSRISQTIKTLEARIGERLFLRTSRSVALTAAGVRFRGAVQDPYLRLTRGVAEAQAAATAVAGTLRIGMYTESLGGPHLLAVVKTFEAAHSNASVTLTSLGLERNYLEVLRAGEVDMLATRLPVSDSDLTIGPILSDEPRVLLVAVDHPLASLPGVTCEEFGDFAVSDAPALPREMIDVLIPPRTPSGRPYRRCVSRSIEDMLLNIATGRVVHPTVPSFLHHHTHPAVTSVPIVDLPNSQTSLVWLSAGPSPLVTAFVRVATRVLRERAR